MSPLLVSEVFGPTIQGEGPSTGRRCGFVRLGLCNLDCRWCDTPYTWDWSGKVGPPQDRGQLAHLEPQVLADRVNAMGVNLVVLTGGEPLVQQAHLPEHLVRWHPAVHVETNGTLAPSAELQGLVAHWSVSPKLGHAGTSVPGWRADVLAQFVDLGAAIKVVVRGPEDVADLARRCATDGIPAAQVWVMPEGRTPQQVQRTLADVATPAVDAGFNVSDRLHVQAWGDRRGM